MKQWIDRNFSARAFCLRALALLGCYAVVHVLGWRDYVGFLSGTYAADGPMRTLSPLLGTLYMVAYLGAVVLAPIYLIAAGIIALLARRSAGGPS